MTDTRSSALFKRAEQLKRWEESDTNKQSAVPRKPSKIKFSSGIVFLAACTAGDKDEVQRLLKMGADINTANVDGLTALHQACIDDNLDMVEFLVSRGADVNRGDNEGWTPLHATASCGFLSIARYLLENGADVSAVNYDGELAVDIAESEAMEEMLQKVIDEKGIDCDSSRNAEVDTLAEDAKKWAVHGYVEVKDPKTGGTPLHVAAAKGYIDVVQLLLETCKVDPDCIDDEGWTPLHAAALWGQKEAAALLIKYGADCDLKNYSGQTCMDLVDPTISAWLAEAKQKATKRIRNNNNYNVNKRKLSPPDNMKGIEVKLNMVNDITSSELIGRLADGKPPKARPPSPDSTSETNDNNATNTEESPSWRRSASFRTRLNDAPRENKATTTNNTPVPDNETILRRTHSFENDKTFYQRYRDVTARIKASSCPSIPPIPQSTLAAIELKKKIQKNNQETTNNTTASEATNEDIQLRVNPADRRDREANTWTHSSPASTAQTTVRRSFVPPVRDEESETQRKAHAKRVRETRRSTQGVTLDEIKSAEQLVKKKTGNGTTESTATGTGTSSLNNNKKSNGNNEQDAAVAIPVNNVENNTFELEDTGRVPSPRPASTLTTTDTSVTLPLRRSPVVAAPTLPSGNTEKAVEEDRDREQESNETKSPTSSPSSTSSTQAALNVIQRRRRPKRRSTGVGHVEMDEIVNDRGGAEGDSEGDNSQSGSERTSEGESAAVSSSATVDGDERDYKALYEASAAEVKRLRELLATSEQQLRDSRATISRLTQVNQNSLSEIEKREKRAMERKLSEMEEELKFQQALQAENQRLKNENGALIRVISKLSK